MSEIACAECGKGFVQTVGVRPKKFCCHICYRRWYYRQPKRAKLPLEGVCDVCSSSFLRKKGNQRYCSRSCYTKAWPKLNADKNAAKSNKRRQEKRDWYRQREPEYVRAHKMRTLPVKPWFFLFRSARARAKERGFDFELTDEWARGRWDGCCEITGVMFVVNPRKSGPHPWSATLDRIDSSIGYTKDNSRFILWACNALRGTGTDSDMIRFAKAISATVGHAEGASDISALLALPI